MRGIEIRNKNVQINISTQPGIYRWYMSESLADKLDVPIDGCQYEESVGYMVYVGIAKSMRQRLVWHTTQKHLPSAVRSGFLSTLRQTLAGLAKVPMDDTETVNSILDDMFVKFEYCVSKEEASQLEKGYFQSASLPLNIMGNSHPFAKELKRLRKDSKNKFMKKN
jgi:hypothetical protein